MQKEYRYSKKQDDYGDVISIGMTLTATNDAGQTVTLRAMHVVGDQEKSALAAMNDSELLSYSQNVLDATYNDQSVVEAFNVQHPTLQDAGE